MNKEYLVLVDENDKQVGIEEKVKCHLPNGKLHRAFTALLFNENGNLVITRRSSCKMLWPSHWDGTVASHPRENETYISSAQRRMPEEIGIPCVMDYLFKFEYHVPYKDVGSENEICGTLLGIIQYPSEFKLVEDEISEIRFINEVELAANLKKNPQDFCPWMLIALYLLPHSDKNMLEKYKTIISKWTKPEINKNFEESIKFHVPDRDWRLVI